LPINLPQEFEKKKKDKEFKKYPCVYGLTDDCPVKHEYKLKPESLVEFCKKCHILSKHREIKIQLSRNGKLDK